jgi:hypothetical protein
MTDVTLPSFGFGTVTQTAVVEGALAAQSDRYESGQALRDGQAFTDVLEGFIEIPGKLPSFMVPAPFVPSVLELAYKVHLPEGFELASGLPEHNMKSFGPAILDRRAEQAADGTLQFLIRLDASKAHFNAAMTAEFGKELAASLDRTPPFKLNFVLSAYVLIQKGLTVQALDAFDQRVARQPDAAIEHLRLSEALSILGLPDRALEEAQTAVHLTPNSVAGLLGLARRREGDPLGRMFQPGFDREGALDVLRTLTRSVPDNLVGHYALVDLLEHDADGIKYSYSASLAEAANELLAIRKLPGYADSWDNELLQLLGMTGQFEKIPALVAGMKMSDYRRGWLLASVFYTGGEKAARAAAGSAGLKLDRAATNRAFYGAAGSLEIARQYDKARQLMALSTVEPKDAAARAYHLQLLGNMKRHEEEVLDETSPADTARKWVVAMLRPSAGRSQFDQVLSRTAREAISRTSFDELGMVGARDLSAYTQQGYPVDVAIDMVLSRENVGVEGNAQDGFIVRARSGDSDQEAFFVMEGGEARVLATSKAYMFAGSEALARADAGLEKEALSVLNWGAKFAVASTSSDPLGTAVFRRFWPLPDDGDDGDAGALRYAAAALGAPLGDPAAVPVLLKGRNAATSDLRRLDFDTALAAVYFKQQSWKELAPVAERLSKAFPDSLVAFQFRTVAYRGLQDWPKAEAAAADWLGRHRDDPDGILARVLNAAYQGKFHDGRAILAPFVAAGSANTSLLNEYAWLSVAANEVDLSAVQAARKVTEEFARRHLPPFRVNHTLACVLALSGQPKEALDVLVKAMNAAGMTGPNSSSWFAQGLIAEAYQDIRSAQLLYGRVQAEPLRDEDPASSYNLARRRLERLDRPGSPPHKEGYD